MMRILTAVTLALAAATPALAADLPPPMAPAPRAPSTYVPMAEPVFSWTGIYFGINGGYGFGQSNWTAPGTPSTGNFDASGFLVGGTLGANYQMGAFVLGVEGDVDWSNIDGTVTCGFGYTCETQSDWLGTARARAGYAWNRILFYGTGGAAFGNIQAGCCGLSYTSATQIGWTAGAGIEAAFAPNWTAKIEYLYVDLGNMSCGTLSCGTVNGASTSVSLTENLVRAGVNYKFSW